MAEERGRERAGGDEPGCGLRVMCILLGRPPLAHLHRAPLGAQPAPFATPAHSTRSWLLTSQATVQSSCDRWPTGSGTATQDKSPGLDRERHNPRGSVGAEWRKAHTGTLTTRTTRKTDAPPDPLGPELTRSLYQVTQMTPGGNKHPIKRPPAPRLFDEIVEPEPDLRHVGLSPHRHALRPSHPLRPVESPAQLVNQAHWSRHVHRL